MRTISQIVIYIEIGIEAQFLVSIIREKGNVNELDVTFELV